MALKRENKIKSTMFIILCVFGGLVGYDEIIMWNSFWDGRKYEQPNENSSRFCESNFCKVIGKGDFEEMKIWGDEDIIWGKLKKDLGIILMKILEDHCGGFGGWWRRN